MNQQRYYYQNRKRRARNNQQMECKYEPCHQMEHKYDPCHKCGCEAEKCQHKCCNHQKDEPKWSALDPAMNHPMNNDSTINQDQEAELKNVQQSDECIVIKDSCDVDVKSTDTQASVNIQVALQAAIALVVSVSVADSNTEDEITQELFAKLKSSQINKQKLYIENSRGVKVTTTDTDIAVNAQVLLQVLLALVIRLDIA